MNSTTKVLIAMAMAVVVSVSFVSVSAHTDGAEGEFTEIGTADELKSCIGTDGQYRLTADIGLGDLDADNGSAFTVPSGVTVTLDLNGHDITASIASDNGNYTKAQIIRNEGNLTILDNSDGEHGSIDNQGQSYPCTLTIYNSAGATLTIQNVLVISEEAVAIDNRGTCHIKEGTVLLAENDTFAGGGWDNTCAAIENRGAGNLYIDGATVTSVSQAAVFSDSSGITEVRNSTVSGSPAYGDFNGTTADTNIRVYSGLFSCDPSTVVDSRSLVSVTEDGYEVNPISGTSTVTVSSPGELQSTIEGVGPSELLMVELATDDVLTGNITIPANVMVTVQNGATLTIAESAVIDLSGAIVNNGTIVFDGYMNNPGNIQNNGTAEGVSTVVDGVYEVHDAMDLQWLTYILHTGDEALSVELMDDIAMPGIEFQTIGSLDSEYFVGTFDGNGYAISGLKISNDSQSTALFLGLADAQVLDLELSGIDYSTRTGYIGGLAAYTGGTVLLKNISVSGTISVSGGSYGCASMLASAWTEATDVTLVNCVSTSTIGGSYAYNVGSMIGSMSGSQANIKIIGCSNSGEIAAKGSYGQVFGYGHLGTDGSVTIIDFDSSAGEFDTTKLDSKISSAAGSGYTISYEGINADMAVLNSDGSWTYGDEAVSTMEAESNGLGFASLQTAIQSPVAGPVITLKSDVTADITVPEGREVTLEGADFTLSGSVTVEGTLTINSGKYTADVSEYLAPGKMLSEDGEAFVVVDAAAPTMTVSQEEQEEADGTATIVVSFEGLEDGATPTYVWSNGASTASVTVTETGTYGVTVTVTSYGVQYTLEGSVDAVVTNAVTVVFPSVTGAESIVIEVDDGEQIDMSAITVPEGFLLTGLSTDGEQFTGVVDSNMTLDAAVSLSTPTATVGETVEAEGYTEVRIAVQHPVDGVSYMYYIYGEAEEPLTYNVTGMFVLTESGSYTFGVVATLSDGDTVLTSQVSVGPMDVEVAPVSPSDEPDLGHPGASVDIPAAEGTTSIVSDADLSDVTLSLDYEGLVSLEIVGNVGEGAVTVTVVDVGEETRAGVDVSLNNIAEFVMIIKFQVPSVNGMYASEVRGYYIGEDGSEVNSTTRIMGEEVWIYTDHNTPYYLEVLEYGSTDRVYEDDPLEEPSAPQPDEPDTPSVNPDEDLPLPPLIVQEPEASGDNTVEIVACAAAAVVAALIAAFLIIERRR